LATRWWTINAGRLVAGNDLHFPRHGVTIRVAGASYLGPDRQFGLLGLPAAEYVDPRLDFFPDRDMIGGCWDLPQGMSFFYGCTPPEVIS